MDVFGTVVGTIDLASKLINYVKTFKGGKQNRLELISELSALKTLLEIMSGRLSNTNVDGSGDDISNNLVKAGIKGPLNACYGALKFTVDSLERTAQKYTGKPPPFGRIIRDLKWPFRQEDIKAMLGKIERLKSLIMLALQTSLTEFIEKAHNELVIVGANVEDIKSIISSLRLIREVRG
ncbi:hypothetical protein BD779DRAFT_1474773 [Infundibulicybe gibba]|nr:hypothetical protein BD779DRAFT_1474773 [Infundibulicybe gibba]